MVRVIERIHVKKSIGEVTNCASIGQHKRSSIDIIDDSDIIEVGCCDNDEEEKEILVEEDPQNTDEETNGESGDSDIVDVDKKSANQSTSDKENEEEIDDSDIVDTSSDNKSNPNMTRPSSPMNRMNTGNKSISI